MDKLIGDKRTISRQQHRLNQYKITINHLHDRLASIQHAKRNRDSHIARLKDILELWGICHRCGKSADVCNHLGDRGE